MAKKEKFTPAEVAAALRDAEGMVYLAAERLDVAASTVYRYAERHPEVREAMDHQKGRRLDTAENKLWAAVKRGSAWAVCFFLKTQGKARGYVERQEIEQAATNRLVVEEVEYRGDADQSASPPAPRPDRLSA
jgi:hypothetical protein